jgi:8-oxo-dGTP pyrophosphatase MutT (NUDIX family)
MITEREAVRAIILTPKREVLLMRIRSPDGERAFWIAPGGGLETGETNAQALRRELQEELGLRAFQIGPLVWRRQHTFTWDGKRIRQREHYHVVHAARFEPRMSDQKEARTLDLFRWWSTGELAQAKERLTPVSLASIVASYLASGAPADLPGWEVLAD